MRLYHLLVMTATVTGLGINCRGSTLCEEIEPAPIPLFLAIIGEDANSCSTFSPIFDCGPLNDTDIYAPGAHIVCLPIGVTFLGGICAFTQGNVPALGILGKSIKRKLKQLKNHGCKLCGSVPLAENNNPYKEGILTVNYVAKGVCKGLCPPTHYQAL